VDGRSGASSIQVETSSLLGYGSSQDQHPIGSGCPLVCRRCTRMPNQHLRAGQRGTSIPQLLRGCKRPSARPSLLFGPRPAWCQRWSVRIVTPNMRAASCRSIMSGLAPQGRGRCLGDQHFKTPCWPPRLSAVCRLLLPAAHFSRSTMS